MTSGGSKPAFSAGDQLQYGPEFTDRTVEFKVGRDGQLFRVSAGRLIMRSPLFKEMFTLPQPSNPIAESDAAMDLSDIDLDEFNAYLWFINADPISAQKFFARPSDGDKCSMLFGIAILSHRFQAGDVVDWAIKEGLAILHNRDRYLSEMDVKLAGRLLRMSSLLRIAGDTVRAAACKKVVCDAIDAQGGPASSLSWDPVPVLSIARSDEHREVLFHVYHKLLRMGTWKDDARLLAIDRRRLLCGYYSCAVEAASTPAPHHRQHYSTAPSRKLATECRGEQCHHFEESSWNLCDEVANSN
ncbi:hypothetical protein AURDEDRAFT_188751 [Auricularia subglabra TFB-10046 SS5]|uniref:BTB domain-containing protein n=1 Tax=Auricularia subglabra (strain TFB-10046 / SS5) TaxID=717982 RepID=J0CXB9_AURST|nr:hypothetical protein AURDEDRAFT_188751 [Auricularia subglabra TFB-10046 SS5]